MKKLNFFEYSILGFLAGVVTASYLVYLEGLGRVIGSILSFISLMPIFDLFKVADNQKLIFIYLFVVVVFMIYGLIIGTISRNGRKTKALIIFLIILLLVGIYFEQKDGTKVQSQENLYTPTEMSRAQYINNNSKQYFSKNEAKGDLNGDSKNDIAFIIPREDKARGNLYYYTASLNTGSGYVGTNLMFLGEKTEPKNIKIEDDKIVIEYIDLTNKKATTTKTVYAEVVGGILSEVKGVLGVATSSTINSSTTEDSL